MSRFEIKDKRIESIVNRTLNNYFKDRVDSLDVAEFSEHLIRETVIECMRQLALPVDLKNDEHVAIVHSQWDHLAKRFGIPERKIE